MGVSYLNINLFSFMNILKDIHKYVQRISQNESLCSLLEKTMNQELIGKTFPSNYYYLTEITNPMGAYYARKHSDVKKPKELARRLSVGNHLHYIASFWFRNVDGFITDEATLDSIWVGIHGIRGRLDYRIGESIIEFKTKPKIPENENDIFTMFPQDLEQLLFYSVIHPHKPKVNYLVFMEDSKPYTIRAFKVIIKDINPLKDIIKRRIDLLNKALHEGNPNILGRCRYHNSGCHFNQENICDCNTLDDIDMGLIEKNINLEYDPLFTNKLNDAREKSGVSETFSLSVYNIIAPRKYYIQEIMGIQSEYEEAYPGYKSCLWQCINNIKSEFKIGLNRGEVKELYDSKSDIRVRLSSQGIKLISSANPEGRITPYILKVSREQNIDRTKYPHEYYLAELGIMCSMYGIDKGLIFVVYPELNKLVRAFEVNFKNTNEIKKEVISRIDGAQKIKNIEDIRSLPPCPQFMNDKGKCPIMKECHSEKGSGCVYDKIF